MHTLDLDAHHPVRLNTLQYISFSFERLVPNVLPEDIFFPDFDIEILHKGILDDNTANIVLNVVSRDEKPSWLGDTEAEQVITFNLTVAAFFRCEIEGNSRSYLETFMSGDTPALIVWPYLRSFVAENLNKTGLPEYHLPLLQIRTQHIEKAEMGDS